MNHVMIDLETLGTKISAPIVAIGAVRFDPCTGETGDYFYAEITLESNMEFGRMPDASTIRWWMQQSDEARAWAKDNSEQMSLKTALCSFHDFIFSIHDAKVWGNGATFDLGKLTHAYEYFNIRLPWEFYNEQDLRTIVRLDGGKTKRSTEFVGTPHNAIDDAKHQIKYLHLTLKNIGMNDESK